MGDPHEDFLRQCIEGAGVSVDMVTSEEDALATKYYVTKKIGGETLRFAVTVTTTLKETRDSMEQILASRGEEIARKMRDEMVDTIRFGTRIIEVCTHDGGWAECTSCSTRVELDREYTPKLRHEAELCVPKPVVRGEGFTDSLTGSGERVLKLYLLGKLRAECADICPNSKYNRNT